MRSVLALGLLSMMVSVELAQKRALNGVIIKGRPRAGAYSREPVPARIHSQSAMNSTKKTRTRCKRESPKKSLHPEAFSFLMIVLNFGWSRSGSHSFYERVSRLPELASIPLLLPASIPLLQPKIPFPFGISSPARGTNFQRWHKFIKEYIRIPMVTQSLSQLC